MKGAKTKEKLLDSAEKLFAKKGLKDTSVRDITGTSGVHLAAVNYHFRSKDGLIRVVPERLSGGVVCRLCDEEETINKPIAFCAVGLRAPKYYHPPGADLMKPGADLMKLGEHDK